MQHKNPVKPGNSEKESRAMEENKPQAGQEDPKPLTDEEFAEHQKKENRKVGIIATIIDFIVSFFT